MFGLSWWHILLVLVVFDRPSAVRGGQNFRPDGGRRQGPEKLQERVADEDEEAQPEPRLVERRRAETNQDSQRTSSKAPKRTRKTA
jgi:hypothetical protein